MTYSIIIPIYNEIQKLSTLIKKLRNLDNSSIEIIIINDGSTDGSVEILNDTNQFVIINNETNLGKGLSVNRGLKSASMENIILIDGDLEVDIDDIPKLIKSYENSNCDALVGIRWEKGNNYKLDINTTGNHIINNIFNKLFSSSLNDVLCCVKILDTKLFRSLNISSIGFGLEVEIMTKLVMRESRILEEFIKYNRRTVSEGKKLKLSDGWIILWTMIKFRLIKIN